MGLASELGYEIGEKNVLRRGCVVLASTRPVAVLANKALHSMDRFALRLTGGKSNLTSWLIGVPTLWLTTTGAKSGLARTVPLLGIPIGDDLALLGTRFGQKASPAWVHNLEAEPRAVVAYRGVEVRAWARSAEPDESSAIWESVATVYSGALDYAERATHRRIRAFVLEPDPIR